MIGRLAATPPSAHPPWNRLPSISTKANLTRLGSGKQVHVPLLIPRGPLRCLRGAENSHEVGDAEPDEPSLAAASRVRAVGAVTDGVFREQNKSASKRLPESLKRFVASRLLSLDFSCFVGILHSGCRRSRKHELDVCPGNYELFSRPSREWYGEDESNLANRTCIASR